MKTALVISAIILISAVLVYFAGSGQLVLYAGNLAPVFLSLLASIAWSVLAFKTPKVFNVDKNARICIAGFLWLNFLGELSWAFYELILHEAAPISALPDVFWQLSYIFLIAGLILYIRTVFIPKTILVWFTVVFVGLAAAHLIHVLAVAGLNWTAIIQSLYVVWDLIAMGLILAVLVPLVFSYNRFVNSWLLFLTGILGIVIFDMLFSAMTIFETYRTGSYIDLIYFSAYLLLGLAACSKCELISTASS